MPQHGHSDSPSIHRIRFCEVIQKIIDKVATFLVLRCHGKGYIASARQIALGTTYRALAYIWVVSDRCTQNRSWLQQVSNGLENQGDLVIPFLLGLFRLPRPIDRHDTSFPKPLPFHQRSCGDTGTHTSPVKWLR